MTLRLYDDEGFSLHDNIKRRTFYQPILNGNEVGLFDAAHRPEQVIALNLTARHFTTDGATQFAHLEPDDFNLVSMLFNASAFATGKKKRVITNAQNTTNRRRRQQQAPRSGPTVDESETGGESEDLLLDAADRQQHYFQGAQQVSHFVDVMCKADEKGLQVVGYRFFFTDSSTDGNGLDLVTRGMQEVLAEASIMQLEKSGEEKRLKLDSNADGVTTATATSGKKSTGNAQSRLELKPHYRYCTRYTTYPIFLTLAANYFARDDRLWQQRNQRPDAGSQCFIDRREFLRHNQDGADQAQLDTLPLIFSKEAAMVYHVETAGVQPRQRLLSAYCPNETTNPDEELQHLEQESVNSERLCNLFNASIDDREFCQVPFPAITYRMDPRFICSEILPLLPVPHRLGSYLHTEAHRQSVVKRIHNSRVRERRQQRLQQQQDRFELWDDEEEQEMEMDEESHAGPDVPLGMHDLELELTPDQFYTHRQYVSDDVLLKLSSGNCDTVLDDNVKSGLLNRVTNEVQMELLTVAKAVDQKKTYYWEPPKKTTSGGGGGDHTPPKTTEACTESNSNKQHALDRRVHAVVGRSEAAKIKDGQAMLFSGNMAYYRTIIGKWRPIAATVENAVKHCRNLKYDPIFLERDIYWVLDSLNEEGFGNLDRAFFDSDGKVRQGELQKYLSEKRLFIEAITAEFFHEFFTSPRVSPANLGIRNDLKKTTTVDGARKNHLGTLMTLMKYDKQVMPFHNYMLWTYSYFTEQCGISRLFKQMNIVYHAKFHQGRTYPPGTRDPKLNVVMLGHGMVGKSHLLASARVSCPTDVAIGVSHWTAQTFNVDQNTSDICMIQDEMTTKLLGANMSNKTNAGHSDAGQDDARNNAKERATSHESTTMSFYQDEETGERRMRISKAQNQFVMLGASNVAEEEIDPNVKSRFICLSVARSMNEAIGDRAQDKTPLPLGVDSEITTQQMEEVREVHRLVYMGECMCKSGILQNRMYGVSMNAATIYVNKVLDLMNTKYGINTNNIRKRKFVLEMARTLTMAKAAYWTLKSPEERHLFHDPYTRRYGGLNPRVLLDGFAKLLVCGKGEVAMSLTMLDCLWGHEHEAKVLETFAITRCGLDKLKEQSFLHRAQEDCEATTALQNYDRRKKAYVSGGDAGNHDNYVLDYNYITMTMKSLPDIYSFIAVTMGNVCIAPSEISHILRELSKLYLLSDGYVMEVVDGKRRLVASGDPEQKKQRKIVDYGKDAKSGQPTIALHVGFVKQKLSHLLSDELIEDLTDKAYARPKPSVAPPVVVPLMDLLDEADAEPPTADPDEDEEDENVVDEAATRLEIEQRMEAELYQRLQSVMVVQPNTASDTAITKALREILEHDILQWTGEYTAQEEAEDLADYADVITGKSPCFSFVIADCPPPQKTDTLFPDLINEYKSVHGYSKEVMLVSKMSVLELERKKDCRPFVTFNFNTASPLAKSSLAVHNTVDDEEAEDYMQYIEEVGLTAEERAAQRAQDRLHREQERLAQQKRDRVIAKNRFKMYADTPVFYSTRDLDYDECKYHLLTMAYPMSVARRNGRLCNYEPHMYMNMMDYRDKREKDTGKTLPLVPVFADVLSQVATQRKIIEATLNKTPVSERKTYSQLCHANYNAVELEDMDVQHSQRTRRGKEHRDKVFRQKADAMAVIDTRYRITAVSLPKAARPSDGVDHNPKQSKKSRHA